MKNGEQNSRELLDFILGTLGVATLTVPFEVLHIAFPTLWSATIVVVIYVIAHNKGFRKLWK